jgi:AAA+ superfamily predicted ATPase
MTNFHLSSFLNDSNHQLFKELERIDLCLQQYTQQHYHQLEQPTLQDFLLDDDTILERINNPRDAPHWMVPYEPLVHMLYCDNNSKGLLSQLVERFELTAFEADILLLGLLAYFDSRYFALFGALHRHENKKQPSFELALQLLGSSPTQIIEKQVSLLSQSPLLKHHLITVVSTGEKQGEGWGQNLFQTSAEVFHFLTGNSALSPLLSACAKWHPVTSNETACPPSVLAALQTQKVEKNDGMYPVLMLKGTQGGGRFNAIQSAASKEATPVLEFTIANLPKDRRESRTALIQALREVRIREAILVVRDWDEFADSRKEILADWLALLPQADVRIVGLCERSTARLMMPHVPQINLDMPKLSYQEKERLLHHALATDTYTSVDTEMFSRQFSFNQDSLPKILQEAKCYRSLRAPDAPVNSDDLNKAFRLHSQQNFGKLAQRIEPTRTFDDLIVDDELKEQLQEVLIAIKHRNTVLKKGFAEKIGYGTGVSTLFYGDSGTGKTMAAEVIAGLLQVDLIKVDLASVVDKYIGETEKHLARIFDLAEADSGVLFFDEADALFGKRSAVSDSKDRHANIEVAYLLQRLESYPGLVILATNNRGHLDDAFSRRFTFITRFNFPNVAVREQMWRRIWPQNIKLSQDIDFHALAKNAELTGANIRNISLLSAWFAAEEDTPHICEHHIKKAMQRELAKIGRLAL